MRTYRGTVHQRQVKVVVPWKREFCGVCGVDVLKSKVLYEGEGGARNNPSVFRFWLCLPGIARVGALNETSCYFFLFFLAVERGLFPLKRVCLIFGFWEGLAWWDSNNAAELGGTPNQTFTWWNPLKTRPPNMWRLYEWNT